jgi:hypothetical protein
VVAGRPRSRGDLDNPCRRTACHLPRRHHHAGQPANRPLGDLPELRALASRIAVHKLQISDAEMCGHMRRIARQGWSRYQHKLEAALCSEVCELVIAECRQARCPLDLRLLDHACTDYLLWEASNSHLHWTDLVTTRVQQAAAHFRHEVSTLSRAEQKARERDLVRDILCRSLIRKSVSDSGSRGPGSGSLPSTPESARLRAASLTFEPVSAFPFFHDSRNPELFGDRPMLSVAATHVEVAQQRPVTNSDLPGQSAGTWALSSDPTGGSIPPRC